MFFLYEQVACISKISSMKRKLIPKNKKSILVTSVRAIMKDVKRDNRVLSLVNKAGLRNQLTTMLDQLQRCQKSLNEFLEVRCGLVLFLNK